MKYKRLSLFLALGVLSGIIFHKAHKSTVYFAPFEDAQVVHYYTPSDLINFQQKLMKKKWKIVRRNYKRNLAGKKSRHKKEKIPKIIHQIWLGNEPIPDKILAMQTTWKKHHPDWDYHLWTDKEIEFLYLQNKDLYEKQSDIEKKQKILRFEILYQFGGIFVENSFECIAPIDILHEMCDFFAPLTDQIRSPQLSTSVIAAIPKHPVIRKALENIHHQSCNEYFFEEFKTLFTRCYFEVAKKNSSQVNIALPATFFYQLPNEMEERPKQKCIFAISTSDCY